MRGVALRAFVPFSNWSAVSPYATILVAAALICLLCAVISWRRRATAGSLPSTFSMAAAAIWALFYAFELATPGLTGKLVWAKLQYVGIAVLPVAWCMFALTYTGVVAKLKPRCVIGLGLIPTVTVALVATNGLHGLIWSRVQLSVAGSFPDLDLGYGVWFWIGWTYAYMLLAAGSVLLVRGVWRHPGLYRQQTALVMLAAAVPWIANVLYVARALPMAELDPTPLAFAFSALVLTLNMSRFRLFSVQPSLLPTARHQLLTEMPDAVLVFDVHRRVVTANPAACFMLGLPTSDVAGKTAVDLFGDGIAALAELGEGGVERRFEIDLGEGERSAATTWSCHRWPAITSGTVPTWDACWYSATSPSASSAKRRSAPARNSSARARRWNR